MIQESLQLATVEMSTKLNIQNRSRLTQQHRSIVVTRNRLTLPPTHRSTLTSTVCEKETTQLVVGQMNTITRALQ
ncbi:hypothetical protein F2Q69_00027411 [Brassica cretica]|uniref:Uncharacterized protein n=1 Tax=Brassica cretica TaxID=69181 RepID=A0A8S9S3F8_BRACR|nr:hypothetical protein F2Q69_00027411 [Brassica cretica]